jgi:hypothetical protein
MRIPWLDPQRRRSIALAAVVLSLAGWVLAHRAPPAVAGASAPLDVSRASARFESRAMWGRWTAVPGRTAAGGRRAVSVELRIRAVRDVAVGDIELALRLPPRARILGVWGGQTSDVPSRVHAGSLAPGEERTVVADLEIMSGGDFTDIDGTLSWRTEDAAREQIVLPPLHIDDGERLGAR